MHKLEQMITEWRKARCASREVDNETIDELENHVRIIRRGQQVWNYRVNSSNRPSRVSFVVRVGQARRSIVVLRSGEIHVVTRVGEQLIQWKTITARHYPTMSDGITQWQDANWRRGCGLRASLQRDAEDEQSWRNYFIHIHIFFSFVVFWPVQSHCNCMR